MGRVSRAVRPVGGRASRLHTAHTQGRPRVCARGRTANAHAQRRALTAPARPPLPTHVLAGIGNYPECFQAQHPCKDCWWHSKCFCAHLPAGSCENRRKGAHAAGCKSCAPRTDAELEQQLSVMRGSAFSSLSKTAKTAWKRDNGLARWRPSTRLCSEVCSDVCSEGCSEGCSKLCSCQYVETPHIPPAARHPSQRHTSRPPAPFRLAAALPPVFSRPCVRPRTLPTPRAHRALIARRRRGCRPHAAINYLPGASAETDLKPDIMHIFMNGISRHEGQYMMDDVTGNTDVTWDAVNVARKNINLSLPPSHRVPELYPPKASDGKSKASRHLTLNASAMLHLIINRCVREVLRVVAV